MDNVMLQISVFADFRNITPAQDNLIALMRELPGFLPVALKTLNVDAVSGNVENIDRIQMKNNATGWRIDVQLERINVVYATNSQGADVKSYEALIHNGTEFMKKVFDSLNITTKVSRLAINAQFVHPTGKDIKLVSFANNLPSYVNSADELLEWSCSINKKGSIKIQEEETTNEILGCALATAVNDPSQHAVLVTTDINTSQNKQALRFEISDMLPFAAYAIERMKTMLSSVEEGM